MTSSRSSNREEAVADVAAGAMGKVAPTLPKPAQALVVDDATGLVEERLCDAGLRVRLWRRRLAPVAERAPDARGVTPWPEAAPACDLATLRLPESWDAFAMMLHAVFAALKPDGRLLVYGANDEGVRSVARHIEEAGLYEGLETLETRSHCRVVSAWRSPSRIGGPGEVSPSRIGGPGEVSPSRIGGPGEWRETVRADLSDGGALAWVSYPGIFAHGRLDEGTALLLGRLPGIEQSAGLRVLDYGCGAGVIARRLLDVAPPGAVAAVDLLDRDAVALQAARENVPEGRPVLGLGWGGVEGARYDLVLSNPGLHMGKDKDFGMLEDFLAPARRRLEPGGRLRFVVQRAAPVAALLEKHGFTHEIVAETRRYRVWGAVPAPARRR